MIVGRLGRPRGINGEIFVTPDTDFPDRFIGLEEIFIGNHGNWEKLEIESSRLVSGRPVLLFEGMRSPEDVARLTNCELAVLKENLVELPQESYYIFDLIGCEVIEENTGRLFGKIVDVEQYPANDAYVIDTVKGDRILFPAVKQFVKEIDIIAKRVTIDVAGMIEDKKS
ncbi:MAG: ribosome maturation factor RimM [candidate division Zixibacteria bacterium]|nr:ribosome maturation factor RimM [candidate division Zixibacteria bacterium]